MTQNPEHSTQLWLYVSMSVVVVESMCTGTVTEVSDIFIATTGDCRATCKTCNQHI